MQLKKYLMFDAINRVIVQVVESGLAAVYVKRFVFINEPEEEPGPEVLTIDHLLVGFGIWSRFVRNFLK